MVAKDEWNIQLKLYDVIRIDHFIGTVKILCNYLQKMSDARNGKWQKGSGT